MNEVRTLRPGLLVSMNTSIRGNIHYRTNELEGVHVTDEGEQRARWETERIVSDPAEHEAAVKLRTKVRGLIVSQCASSAFGLLCPEDKADELRQAIVEARTLVDGFNEDARLTRMSFNVLYGRIAQDDVEAVEAIAAEVRGLMSDMQAGLERLDVKAVRDAAAKAKGLGTMLSVDAKARLEVAVEAARSSCRKIVKAGEAAAVEIDQAAIARIEMARTSFLDLETEAVHVEAPQADARAVDFTDVPQGAEIAARLNEQARQIDPLEGVATNIASLSTFELTTDGRNFTATEMEA